MKFNEPKQIACFLTLGLAVSILGTGCGSGAAPDPALAAQNEEIQKLRQENQQLEAVRSQYEEVQRLQKENQSLPKVRNEFQQATRLKKENELLRQQIAKISPDAAAALAQANATNATARSGAGGGAILAAAGPGEKAGAKDAAAEGALGENDEIMVDPAALKGVMPEIDWEKFGRKEPIGVRALLEKDGIQLTNVQQIRDLGITNFVIRKDYIPTPAWQTPLK